MAFLPLFSAAILSVAAAAVVLGGFKPINVDSDPMAKQALKFAEVEINKQDNSIVIAKVDQVISAEKQTVAGANYRFKLHLAKTTCPKAQLNQNVDISSCPLLESIVHTGMTCEVLVYVPLSSNGLRLAKKSCSLERSFQPEKRALRAIGPITGGFQPTSVEADEDAFKALEFAEYKINTDDKNPDSNVYIVDDVKVAEKQVVNGLMFHFKVHLAKTSCTKGQLTPYFELSRCPEITSDVPSLHVPGMVCDVLVHFAPHANREECLEENSGVTLKKKSCYLERSFQHEKRARRAIGPITGGFKPISVENDKDAFKALEFAEYKINTDVQNRDDNLYIVDDINVAEKQVVNGILFHFKVHLAKTSCTKDQLTAYFEMSRCPKVTSDVPGLHVPGMVCDVLVHFAPHANREEYLEENSGVTLKNQMCYYER